jgi:menaquinone-dependent protoporphyrinogen oxidase
MTRVLVLYGTTDGHTRKIAARIARTLQAHGLDSDVVNAEAAAPAPDDYAAVVVAASLHAGGYQRSVVRWVRQHVAALEGKTTVFLTVCLGILQREDSVRRELDRLQADFLQRTGWQPALTKHVAGALMYREYNWLKRLAMRRIVRKAGGDIDTSRNYEYTDWNDLDAFVGDLVMRLQDVQEATTHDVVA